ncbi:MAG TPA: hypothetical protein DDZ80_23570 [Cyanobacteria bacterium UBA8803]|nr:hypothetical protein [Cyanobacteria bacterium UBA9273]HBL61301.1 hypothetical protein [Cyanobacteria bacterium UBA8803]
MHNQVSSFQLEGQFVGFLGKPGGQLKYLRILVAQQELRIKLAKDLRKTLGQELVLGEQIQVFGEKKFKGNLSEHKLKAYHVNRLDPNSSPNTCLSQVLPSPKSGKILLCQKSDCLKRGGKKLYNAVQQALCGLGLEGHIKIEATSCQKRCKQAPNMVLMPGKVKCGQISADAIATLIEEYYLNQQPAFHPHPPDSVKNN